MAESETGYKWWLRYIVVPLIGGGTLLTLFLTAPMREPLLQPLDSQPVPAPTAATSPHAAVLNVTVDPDTVGIEPGKLKAVTYRFKEILGVSATIDTQDVRWRLPDGSVLASERGNRILGGSFTVPAGEGHELIDNVYLPPDIADAARRAGSAKVQLETTFEAIAAQGQKSRAKALLTIFVQGQQ
jgi:hypothetical protein